MELLILLGVGLLMIGIIINRVIKEINVPSCSCSDCSNSCKMGCNHRKENTNSKRDLPFDGNK